jgi:hypothetical protein
MTLLYSIVESPGHPDLSPVYRALGIQEIKLSSQRKAIGQLKKTPPDWVVAEFFYGYGNNYAGVNVSNLDVFLHSQRKYAPDARVIVLAAPPEMPHVDQLTRLFDIHAVLPLPVDRDRLRTILNDSED